MELKELTDKTLELFEVKSVEKLGQQLLEVSKGTDKLEAFCNLRSLEMRYFMIL